LLFSVDDDENGISDNIVETDVSDEFTRIG